VISCNYFAYLFNVLDRKATQKENKGKEKSQKNRTKTKITERKNRIKREERK
jgi:hypothetical protein